MIKKLPDPTKGFINKSNFADTKAKEKEMVGEKMKTNK